MYWPVVKVLGANSEVITENPRRVVTSAMLTPRSVTK